SPPSTSPGHISQNDVFCVLEGAAPGNEAVRLITPGFPASLLRRRRRLEAIYTKKTRFWYPPFTSPPAVRTPAPASPDVPGHRRRRLEAIYTKKTRFWYPPFTSIPAARPPAPASPAVPGHRRRRLKPYTPKPRFWVFQAPASRIECERSHRPRRPLHVVGAHVSGPYRPKTRLLSIPSPSTQDSAVRALALASQASQRRRRGHP
ncbi:hypothetical protein B0H10DRAFT_2441347, partial [Mycena sp. CBHHK59/15]